VVLNDLLVSSSKGTWQVGNVWWEGRRLFGCMLVVRFSVIEIKDSRPLGPLHLKNEKVKKGNLFRLCSNATGDQR